MDPNPALPPLARAILNTLAYADVFDYPLTAGQIQRYLGGMCAAPAAVSAQLERLAETGAVSRAGPYYLLRGRDAIVSRREQRERVAKRLWPRAVRYGRIIAGLPFVRMLAVTGSLAMNNSDEDGDIDYLIVTVPDQLWLCRLMVLAVVRLAAWRGLRLCPNYMISERALVLSEHNLYAAHEFAQMALLCGWEVYRRMWALNPWVQEYLPNAQADWDELPAGSAAESVSRLRPLLESALSSAPGARLGNWEMARKIRRLSQENAGNPEAVFNADLCKGHSRRHGQRTTASLAERLERLALETRE